MPFLGSLTLPVRSLSGVGPRTEARLHSLDIASVADLLQHFPRDYLDRTRLDLLAEAGTKNRLNCLVEVKAHRTFGRRLPRGGRYEKVLKVMVQDPSAQAGLICYGRSYLRSTLIPGRSYYVSGAFQTRHGEIQSSNFEYQAVEEMEGRFDSILPIYPLSAGLSQNTMRKLVRQALENAGPIADELPPHLLRKRRLPDLGGGLRAVHFPASPAEARNARQAFIYRELFYVQMIMNRRAAKRKRLREQRKPIAFQMRDALLERLPFRLTPGQTSALEDIEADLFSPQPMSRLLQGDVGCGKTLVALLAAVSVAEAGEQVAFMAPTELLAHQHADSAARMLEPLGIRVALLSSSVSSPGRRLLLQALKAGEIQLLTGTHALFSRDVRYHRLGLVVVDEQQRFGVQQRLSLLSKASSPDLLLMTATPIPRTLALTAFGDLDVSTIRTMPPGRRPVKTHLTRQGNEHRVYRRVRAEISRGRQAYFVYPVIESTDQGELKAAEEMFENLSRGVYPDLRVGLIHSRVPEEEKQRRMAAFGSGDLDILVATSVVEVGVDVPNATSMVVEHAERFGLSALHQLRGRIGRGEFPSYAFLIYGSRLTQDGIRRLKIMMETTDGFRIAEEDLSIRGPGELLGIKQAGFFRFRIADLARDTEILFQAREDVHAVLKEDPGLLLPENRCIREVLSQCPPFDEAFLDGG